MQEKQEKKKIFQPKVIIGSIASFIVAAVSIVAVFFPDLFNLQKKSLNESEFVLKSGEDLSNFSSFLTEHAGKAVKMSVGYCPTEQGKFEFSTLRPSNEQISIISSNNDEDIYLNELPVQLRADAFVPTQKVAVMRGEAIVPLLYPKEEEFKRYDIKTKYDDYIFRDEGAEEYYSLGVYADVKGILDDRIVLEKPTFHIESGLIGGRGLLENISIKDDKDYTFIITNAASYQHQSPFYDKIISACRKTEAADDVTPVAFFEGYFFVNESSGDGMGSAEIVIEPISRKEFELKNY